MDDREGFRRPDLSSPERVLSPDYVEKAAEEGEEVGEKARKRYNSLIVLQKEGLSVTMGEVRSWARLRGTQRYFGKNSTEELLRDVSTADLAAYIWERKKAHPPPQGAKPRPLDIAAVEKEVEERLREYLAAYDASTPNDLEALRQLAFLDVQVAHLRRLIAPWLETPDPAIQRMVREMSNQVLSLLEASRRHQKALQIDVQGREQSRGARKADEIIADTVRDAARLLQEEILPVRHCGILIGWIWWGFPTHPFQPILATCPRCGKPFYIPFPEAWKERAISATDFALDLELLDLLASGQELEKGLPEESRGEEGTATLAVAEDEEEEE